ncbi:hypothetical protein [Mycobacterium sp. 360MFTsu5.1]|uniref:hypothetical protein n=1 Tax=Mycobacterium sp. 360MFTsu5.1 TaxID=1172186 RepID=UPI00039A5BA1|nr:hypothetical protein [Mycobacterium sp. 360MFTsu5.1]
MSSFEPSTAGTSLLVLTGALPGTWLEVIDSQVRSICAGWDYLNITVPKEFTKSTRRPAAKRNQ